MVQSFDGKVYNSGRAFSIPKGVRDKLGVKDGDSVFLNIQSSDREVLFKGRETLKSGSEIYGTNVAGALIPGSAIHVEVSRPKFAAAGKYPIRNTARKRRLWIVSPNVIANNATVDAWRRASIRHHAAFMGWAPDEQEHKGIGRKFAREISPGDIILIARRYQHKPEVVGFGVVSGAFQTTLKGFTAPEKAKWGGSLRQLSPFRAWTEMPRHIDVIRVLGHTTALRELIPDRNEDEKRVCEWLEQTLSQRSTPESPSPPLGRVKEVDSGLLNLPHDRELEFQVRTRQAVKVAIKREAVLVRAYVEWLKKQQRVLTVRRFHNQRCDAYEKGRNSLIEAKCSTNREYMRMAVGQLLDYAYLGEPQFGKPNMAILVPGYPDPKVVAWLKEQLKISVIWQEKHAFLDNANGLFT